MDYTSANRKNHTTVQYTHQQQPYSQWKSRPCQHRHRASSTKRHRHNHPQTKFRKTTRKTSRFPISHEKSHREQTHDYSRNKNPRDTHPPHLTVTPAGYAPTVHNRKKTRSLQTPNYAQRVSPTNNDNRLLLSHSRSTVDKPLSNTTKFPTITHT